MSKLIYTSKESSKLSTLLEGYLYGLGEVCHALFGDKGETAMYQAIGSFFLTFLKKKMKPYLKF